MEKIKVKTKEEPTLNKEWITEEIKREIKNVIETNESEDYTTKQ
jgi:hypothetical protein